MWLPVSTIAALCVLIDVTDGIPSENDLENVFKERTHSDWKNAWHQEKYSRCRDHLISHLYWACEKDIYRLTRRSDPSFKKYNEYDDDFEVDFPWQTRRKANRIVRFRRSLDNKRSASITNECCKSTGCTWEEYAEYCPTNKRYTSYV